MRHWQNVRTRLVGLLVVLLLTAGSLVVAAHAGEPPTSLAADHVMACIRTAVAAHAGLVKDVESEKGQWRCEVTLVNAAGKHHTLHVEVTINQVVKAT